MTDSVFQQTVARVGLTGATLGLLPPWYDVDTPADVAFLHAHLAAMRLAGDEVQAVRTERLLADKKIRRTEMPSSAAGRRAL